MSADHHRQAARVARNTLYLVVADAANKVLMFCFFIVAARHLGAAGFGIMSFALAAANMLAVFADLGLGVISSREIARDYAAAPLEVSNALAMKLVASGVLVVAAIAGVKVLNYPAITAQAVVAACACIPANAILLYLAFVFQGYERMALSSQARVLQVLLLIAGAFALARGAPSVLGYAWLYTGTFWVGALLALGLMGWKLLRPRLSFDFRRWLSMLKKSVPVGLASAFVMVYYWNGSAFLSRFSGDAAVGLYNAPFRLVLGLGFLPAAIAGAIYPVMSRLAATDNTRLVRVLDRVLRYAVILAVPFGVLGTVLARPIISLLYGAGFGDSVRVMMVLVWWSSFACLNAVLSHFFYAVARPGTVTVQTGLALLMNLLLNAAFIPRLGPIGAAGALVAAESAGFVYLAVQQRRSGWAFSLGGLGSSLWRSVVAAVLGAAAAFVALRLSLPAGIVVGVLVYGLFVLLMGVVRGDDLRALRRLVQRS